MNDDLIAEFVESHYSYFAELVLDEDALEGFKDAANQACRAAGLETEFVIEDGELYRK